MALAFALGGALAAAHEHGVAERIHALVRPAETLETATEFLSGLGPPVEEVRLGLPMCGGTSRYSCVVDGDTLWLEGEKIRIADIDTPEVFSPECAAEAELGARATRRMHELLNRGPFTLHRSGLRDVDRYGRKLRIVRRDGRSLGQILVSEGLARDWAGSRRSWCA